MPNCLKYLPIQINKYKIKVAIKIVIAIEIAIEIEFVSLQSYFEK